MSINKCTFIGRLGQDPEVKFLQSGKAVASFSLACSETYKDKQTGQKVEKTEWIRCVAFDKKGEVIGEYCKKGHNLYVSGKMTTRKWQNKDGVDQYTTEIVVEDFDFLEKREGQSATAQSRPAQSQSDDNDDFDDAIPF